LTNTAEKKLHEDAENRNIKIGAAELSQDINDIKDGILTMFDSLKGQLSHHLFRDHIKDAQAILKAALAEYDELYIEAYRDSKVEIGDIYGVVVEAKTNKFDTQGIYEAIRTQPVERQLDLLIGCSEKNPKFPKTPILGLMELTGAKKLHRTIKKDKVDVESIPKHILKGRKNA